MGTELLLTCNAVADPQWITVALDRCGGRRWGRSGGRAGHIRCPGGDVTANLYVTSADITEVKAQVGNPVHAGNFRADLNANGYLTSADISAVKFQTGSMLH
jgi:hypothetical protein